jgi:hypothetical protein
MVYVDEFFNYKKETLKRRQVSWVNNVTADHRVGCEFMNCIEIRSECRERFGMRSN